jgi:Fe-S cluster assembly protein SufD
MTVVEQGQEVYFESFSLLEKNSRVPSWLSKIRKSAMERFGEMGFPTTRNEEWKFTNVAPITRVPFRAAESNPEVWAEGVRGTFAQAGGSRIVFVNGRYASKLSSLGALPKGVQAGGFADILAGTSDSAAAALLEQHLARHADYQEEGFVALNTAFLEDGAFLRIPNGVVVEEPIYLLFFSACGSDGPPAVSHPRSLVVAGRDSQATVVEGYFGLGEGTYFTNAVTEIVAGENAVIEHYKLQQENESAFHVATLQLLQERSSNFTDHSVSLGGALVRNDVNVVLDGEGGECILNGLYLAMGEQHVDNHTKIDHAKPHCSSRELYKGILDGKAAGVFNGGIIVRKDAQKTDAKQSNKNLLLSEDAVINTKPQLQIWADDVRCTHGATIGQIDPDAIFYLRSRGIDQKAARSLLTYAFTNELLGRMKVDALRSRIEAAVMARLSKDQKAE